MYPQTANNYSHVYLEDVLLYHVLRRSTYALTVLHLRTQMNTHILTHPIHLAHCIDE
jgi:hypothetical protein